MFCASMYSHTMVDLHIHTTASDGQYTPTEIVKKAQAAGLSVIAITDHDTVSGVDEAQAAGRLAGVPVVPGIELTVNWPTGEFHLLGLGVATVSPSLTAIIGTLQEKRQCRNEAIVHKMNAAGIRVTLDELSARFPGGTLGRPHIAAFLVERGIVKNRQQAFSRYLARGKPWYVPHDGVNLDEAIVAIEDSGGAPVIAHPLSLYVSWGKLESVLRDIHGRGVAGIEAYHPSATLHECERLERLAAACGFFVTGASDFHGEAVRADRKIGHTAGGRPIADRFWTDNLEPYLRLHQVG